MANVMGGTGNDNLAGSSGNDTVVGQAGDDTIDGISGNDILLGNQGNDQITDGDGQNFLYGGMDNDQLIVGNGSNLLYGNEGSDTIAAGNGNNTIVGGQDSTDSADLITSGLGSDLIFGNGGDDTVAAGGGADTVVGGFGRDIILGNQGNDIILGNRGDDTLFGGQGNDTLVGGKGNDSLIGGEDNDLIVGSEGDDTASFSGTRASYTVTQDAAGNFILSGARGTDTVSTVEHFQFSDGTIDAANLIQGTGGGGGGGTTPVPPAPSADLFITATVSNATPNVGDAITFTDTLINAGPDRATGVTAADLLPPGLTYVSATATSSDYDPVTGTWAVGFVDPNVTTTLAITATVASAGTLTNTATITHADQTDPAAANNASSVTETANAAPVITTTGNSVYTPGQGPIQIDNNVQITDSDGNNLTSASARITTNFVQGQDLLELGGGFSISSVSDADGFHQVTSAGYTSIHVEIDNNAGAFFIKGTDTHAHYDNLFDALRYDNTSGSPSSLPRTVTFTGTDENGLSSAGADDTINIAPVAVPNPL